MHIEYSRNSKKKKNETGGKTALMFLKIIKNNQRVNY